MLKPEVILPFTARKNGNEYARGCDGDFCRERVHDAHKCIYQALSIGSTAIFDLTALLEVEQTKNAKFFARAEAAEVRCETLEKMVKQYQEELIPGYRERAEKAENIASDLCDDFTDFVTGGVHNAASYCANCRPECVNQRGWCNGDNRFCRGFLPKAARVKEE